MVFSIPNLDEVKDRGNSQKDREDLEVRSACVLGGGNLQVVSLKATVSSAFPITLFRYNKQYIPALIYTPGLPVNATTHGTQRTVRDL